MANAIRKFRDAQAPDMIDSFTGLLVVAGDTEKPLEQAVGVAIA